MTDEAVSPLRRRMIEDMTIRKLAPKTQHDYVQRVKNFAAFLGRSPDTASFEDVRRYQLPLAASGVGAPTVNQTVSTLRFFFKVTLKRHDIIEHTHFIHEPRKLPARARQLLPLAIPQDNPTMASIDPSKPACPCCGGRMIIIEIIFQPCDPGARATIVACHRLSSNGRTVLAGYSASFVLASLSAVPQLRVYRAGLNTRHR